MNPSGTTGLQIDILRLHLSVRWQGFLLPFEQRKFLSLLPEQGYVIDEGVTQSPAFGTFSETSGVLARKGVTSLTMEPSKPSMGLDNPEGHLLVEEFDSLEENLKHGLSFDSPERAAFYEVLFSALVWTDKNALDVLKRLRPADDPLAAKFSETVGLGPAAMASIRLVPVIGQIHSSDWWDLLIDPSFRSPEQCYRVSFVFRNPERIPTMEITKDLVQMIKTTIQQLEESRG